MYLLGGAGLVGGALLADAFEDHDEHEREEGYQDGSCPRHINSALCLSKCLLYRLSGWPGQRL